MFFFQLPWLPEAVFSAFDFRVGSRALLQSSRPATFSAEDLAHYRTAWSQPGALTAMINWYRALFRTRVTFPNKTVHVPTRILWGERDAFLLAEMARESLAYCTSAELFAFANATHWLQHEEPARRRNAAACFSAKAAAPRHWGSWQDAHVVTAFIGGGAHTQTQGRLQGM
jgi:pimeloyl-ACP methyl ester carboxylesterase